MAKNLTVDQAYDRSFRGGRKLPNLDAVPVEADEISSEPKKRSRKVSDSGSTIYLYEDQKLRLEIVRNSEGRALVDVLREAVDEYLENHGWMERVDDEAVAEYAESKKKWIFR